MSSFYGYVDGQLVSTSPDSNEAYRQALAYCLNNPSGHSRPIEVRNSMGLKVMSAMR
jgi:hypothetical protein